MRKTPDIVQIIPAQGMAALFGRREAERDGTVKNHVAETRPVVCWALVSDDEMYVVGMVTLVSGEIMLANQRDDFLEYETTPRSDAPSDGCKLRCSTGVDDAKHTMEEVAKKYRRASMLDAFLRAKENLI